MRYVFSCALGLAVLSLCGCGTGKFTSFEGVSPKEAVAIGKIRILYNGKDVTKGCNITFNGPATGYAYYQYVLDGNGYIFTKLPLGKASLNYVVHRNGLIQHHFRLGELTCQVKDAGAVYYIGNLTLDWRGMGSGAAFPLFLGTGVIGTALLTQGRITAYVESDMADAQQEFRRRFPNNRDVTPALLVVEPQPQ